MIYYGKKLSELKPLRSLQRLQDLKKRPRFEKIAEDLTEETVSYGYYTRSCVFVAVSTVGFSF